jgi:hypothetical protein
MASKDLPQIPLEYRLIKILIELFAVGIFSVEGGGKAWFELILVSAALCACGYILWWQIPLLILAIILGTFAAGMFSLLAPMYAGSENFTVTKTVTKLVILPLKMISKYNLNKISNLSVDQLEQRLRQVSEAQQIFDRNRKIVQQISELESVFKDIRETRNIAVDKVETHRKEREKRQQEEAEAKAQQEKWLDEQRKIYGFTDGCPPYEHNGELICKYPHKIKVTLRKTNDGYDGIIWEPEDKKYKEVKQPVWCYQSVEEAERECGKYKFRIDEYKRKRKSRIEKETPESE